MALTAEEMVEFFNEQAEWAGDGLKHALANKDLRLAASNGREAVKCFMMSGLILWRLGKSPINAFVDAIQFYENSARRLDSWDDAPEERINFMSFLIDQPRSIEKSAILQSDRLLDAQISNWLHDKFNDALWALGMSQLQKSGSKLAVDTYLAYRRLSVSPREQQEEVFHEIAELYSKRQRDAFFSGGDQTEGGGLDNKFVVDYRLAAIAKKLELEIESIHSWRWST